MNKTETKKPGKHKKKDKNHHVEYWNKVYATYTDGSKNVFFIIKRVCLNLRTLFPKSEVFVTMFRTSLNERTPYVCVLVFFKFSKNLIKYYKVLYYIPSLSASFSLHLFCVSLPTIPPTSQLHPRLNYLQSKSTAIIRTSTNVEQQEIPKNKKKIIKYN